jgi:rubrerythrin
MFMVLPTRKKHKTLVALPKSGCSVWTCTQCGNEGNSDASKACSKCGASK